jgi:rSAM/selenodomain-associated transferase 1
MRWRPTEPESTKTLAPGRSRAMAASIRDVTLIVFCREPLAGHTKTRLIPRLGAAGAAELAGAFILDALAKCRALAPGRIVIAGSVPGGAENSRYFRRASRRFGAELIDQGVGSLGVRMARAREPYRAGGAVLFGADTPSLPTRLLGRSVALLRRASVVIAPSLDGGYYLVGVRSPMPDIFRAVAWGRSNVLSETVARLRHGGYATCPAPRGTTSIAGPTLSCLPHISSCSVRAKTPRAAGGAAKRNHPRLFRVPRLRESCSGLDCCARVARVPPLERNRSMNCYGFIVRGRLFAPTATTRGQL